MPGTEHDPRAILVTGGAGFIGSHFIRRLLADGSDAVIVNLDRLTYAGDLARLADVEGDPRLEHIVGDICDQVLVDTLLVERRITTVVHFAAESHVDRSIAGPAAFMQTNVIGTFTLLEACRKYWIGERGEAAGPRDVRFVHVSTDEVYGALEPGDPAFTERHPYAPNSPYAASKAGSDHLVRAYHRTYGLPVVTTHSANNFGPDQHPEKFIPTVIRSCLAGAPIPVYGDGRYVRDWLHVEDHCEALFRILRRGQTGGVYLVGGDNEWENLDIVRLICRIMDGRRPAGAPHARHIRAVPDRPGHDRRYATDATRLREELGWAPARPFEAAIQDLVEEYLEASLPLGEGP